VKAILARLVELVSGRKALSQPTRLSAAEAVEIGSAYARRHGLDMRHVPLVAHEVRDVAGTLVWTLRTPTVGRWLTVEVDDTTGEVTHHQVFGVR
jgi:hypothetical protein